MLCRSASRDDLRYSPRRRRRQAAGGGSLLALGVVGFVLFVGVPGSGGSFGLPDTVRELPRATAPPQGEAPLADAPSQGRDLFAFLRFVVSDVNDFWEGQFREAGQPYQRATLIHGSAAQRQEWFSGGFECCAPGECDTFEAGV